ncbi:MULTISPECIES: hydroxyisourate hydrolase [unclassified Streptomyces]|uniref:hydroxyisourate hydrolase n=1 Tax=unclassified Streptomyces TaxID=2593676 RepID=UPI000CD5A7D7|nr:MULTISPECIES: hydroxyisourate hydrolase [unclassified Streptomyces]
MTGSPATPREGHPATVSTHILDTSAGRPAGGVAVELAARPGPGAPWAAVGTGRTDSDGRCRELPAPPPGSTEARLVFVTGPYLGERDAAATAPGSAAPAFFPEVTVAFVLTPGEHFHVPLLLNPFGYSVYRGS